MILITKHGVRNRYTQAYITAHQRTANYEELQFNFNISSLVC